MLPGWALVPMVVLATAATVIASQAVISGAYSLSRQAVQLGLLPRLEVRHTSAEQAGQIFLPRVNLLLLAGVLLLVMMFRSSGALAVAYGIAVTGTMMITTLLAFVVVRSVWGWGSAAAAALIAPFLLIDTAFLAANLFKIADGGWAPLLIAAALVAVMLTWRRGSRILFEKTRRAETPLADLVRMLERKPPPRVAGTAVYLSADPLSAPTALLHSLKHYKVLHQRNFVLAVEVAAEPRLRSPDRVSIEPVGDSFWRIGIRYGFMEQPNVPAALRAVDLPGGRLEMMATSFFLSRRSIRPSTASMPYWQDRLFIALARNADRATDYFRIPTDRVVEIGTHVTV
jgi:KUP system potassium uptake protein